MKRILLVLPLLLLIGVVLVASVSAQESIQPGDTVTGELSADNYQALYQFEGVAGQTYVITLESSEFDAFLALIASDEAVIDEDDDSGGRLDSQIIVTLEADDTYTIIATSLRAYRSEGDYSASGAFTLTLEESDAPVATPTVIYTPTMPAATSTLTAPPSDMGDDAIGDAATLEFGDVVDGEIGSDYAPVDYTFFGYEGDYVDIELMSDDFDAYLLLFNDFFDELYADDDSGDGTNSFIEGYELPYDGLYTIRATTFDEHVGRAGAAGAFTLSLMLGDAPGNPSYGGDSGLSYGDVAEGELSDDYPAVDYTFEAQAGDIITISQEAFDFDSFIELLDPDGYQIASNDDSGYDLNSIIGPFPITQDGVYTIRASSYGYYYSGYAEVGYFTLRLDQTEVENIAYGDTVGDDLYNYDNYTAAYLLEGTAGDVLWIDLETTGQSVYMRFDGANGQIAQETYGGTDRIGPVVLPQDGSYIISITSYDYESDYTDFSLTVNQIEPIMLELDAPVTANFDQSDLIVYSFEGVTDQAISVMVQTDGGVDTQITLNTPFGYYLVGDDDGGLGFDPEISQVILPEDGLYILLVEPYIRGDNGEFTLTVGASRSVSIDEGAQVVRVSDKNYYGVVTFEAEAGEVVRLTARLLSSSGGEPLITVSQNGDEIAAQTLGKVERLILEFTVPEDGLVSVGLEDYDYTGAVVEFSLERP